MIIATPPNLTPEQAQAYADRILAALERSKLPKPEQVKVAIGYAPPLFDGPSLWAEWHEYRWTDYPAFQAWLKPWLAKVDQLPGCSCSKDFRTVILPKFDFSKIANDEQWQVEAWKVHNAVNRKLGKPEFPFYARN